MPDGRPLAAYVYSETFVEHDMPDHPENATRLTAIMASLRHLGLLPHMAPLPVQPAAEEDVLRVHTAAYLSWLRQAATGPAHMIDVNTYLSAHSYDAAVMAVGGAVAAASAVVRGDVRRAIALLRPPGHHARAAAAYGFCLLNNVACAAAHALDSLGLERILVIDFDVHHGNGTQDAFYTDPRVLYVSMHEWPLFPLSGAAADRGEGPGESFTINVPLPAFSGDATYAACLSEIVEPAARAYRPQLILVSAGYDAHWRDPLAHMAVTTEGFDSMTRRLIALADDLCEGRIAFCLEGGYDLDALAACVANLCAAAAGVPLPLQGAAGPRHPLATDDLASVHGRAVAIDFGRLSPTRPSR